MIPLFSFFQFFVSTSSDKDHAQYLPSSIPAFVESEDLPLRRKRVSVERSDSAERKVWLDTDRQINACQRCTRGVWGKAPVVLCQFLSIVLRSFLSLYFLSLTSTALSFSIFTGASAGCCFEIWEPSRRRAFLTKKKKKKKRWRGGGGGGRGVG